MSIILKASEIIESKLPELKRGVDQLVKKGVRPKMKVILVGSHPASVIYTNNKKKFCEKIGALCEILRLPEDINEQELAAKIGEIADDRSTHGLFVQLPLPTHLANFDFERLIPAEKDVDGFNSGNLIKLLKGDCGVDALIPCTPKGIISLLNFYNIKIAGANVVVIGRSLIVGKPMSMLLTNHDATVTLCHSQTKNLVELTKTADIIILATGRIEFFDATYISKAKKQTIIDVGIGHNKQGKLSGDAKFIDLAGIVHAISPVPGGVGPMTIFSLIQNLLQAAEKSI